MKFFSFQSDTSAAKSSAAQDIPEEVRKAVRIMGAPLSEATSISEPQGAAERTAPVSKKASPFLSEDTPDVAAPASQPEKAAPSLAPVWNPPVVSELQPLFDDTQKLKDGKISRKKLIIAVVCVIFVLILGGVAYWYFFFTKPTPPVVVEPEKPTPVAVMSVTVSDPPYSLTSPNYLTIDTETVTPASLKELLRQPAERIAGAQMNKPVEFLLTDKNNNPIAFSRFAYLMKFELKPDFLASLDESFSLYVFNDAGKTTLGLSLSFAGAPATDDLFKLQKESTMPYALRTFLYDGISVSRDNAFRSGLYNGQAVRYVNIDAENNVSFDYAVRGKVWLIGTSKDTLRAMLDK